MLQGGGHETGGGKTDTTNYAVFIFPPVFMSTVLYIGDKPLKGGNRKQRRTKKVIGHLNCKVAKVVQGDEINKGALRRHSLNQYLHKDLFRFSKCEGSYKLPPHLLHTNNNQKRFGTRNESRTKWIGRIDSVFK